MTFAIDQKRRAPGCQCQYEEGDSPCPVHDATNVDLLNDRVQELEAYLADAKAECERLKSRAVVLAEAERLLREAGIKRVILSGPPHDFSDFVEIGSHEVAGDPPVDGEWGLDDGTLPDAYARLVAAKRREEGGG